MREKRRSQRGESRLGQKPALRPTLALGSAVSNAADCSTVGGSGGKGVA